MDAMLPVPKPSDAGRAIETIRRELGRRLLIVGHYYQRDEVLQHVDAEGDSLELARRAAAETAAERIVFCGVHFMAESAAILAGAGRAVYLPDANAGCPMADMAPCRQVAAAWDALAAAGGGFLPVVYVNSSAALKAWAGRLGGLTCTSSNAARAFDWVRRQGARVFFIPDRHLGTNTALDLGISGEEMTTWNPGAPAALAARVQVLLWPGYCFVHNFTSAEVAAARRRHPKARIIVHPETPADAARLADARGSTSQIIRYVAAQPEGATLVIGTELHLVERLARQQRGRRVVLPLRPAVCRNMSLTDEAKLLALLENWPDANRVRVPPDRAQDARLALDRMLALK